jgi:hypothetical protein
MYLFVFMHKHVVIIDTDITVSTFVMLDTFIYHFSIFKLVDLIIIIQMQKEYSQLYDIYIVHIFQSNITQPSVPKKVRNVKACRM